MKKTFVLAMGAMLGIGGMAVTSSSASAANLPFSALKSADVAPSSNGVINVADRDRRMRHNWDRRRDGDRCSRRFGRCQHYRNGYYYETPWWTLPLIVGGTIAAQNYDDGYDDYDRYDRRGYGRRHIEWCSDRYRSYNPRTNTWIAYSGAVNQCVSPY